MRCVGVVGENHVRPCHAVASGDSQGTVTHTVIAAHVGVRGGNGRGWINGAQATSASMGVLVSAIMDVGGTSSVAIMAEEHGEVAPCRAPARPSGGGGFSRRSGASVQERRAFFMWENVGYDSGQRVGFGDGF